MLWFQFKLVIVTIFNTLVGMLMEALLPSVIIYVSWNYAILPTFHSLIFLPWYTVLGMYAILLVITRTWKTI